MQNNPTVANIPDNIVSELRKLRRKISKMIEKRDNKIHKIKRQSINKHLPINKKAQTIIQASTNLYSTVFQRAGQYLIQDDVKLVQETQPSNICTMPVKNEGICQYWKKVIYNNYKQNLQITDLQLLSYFKQISVKEYSQYKISIQFVIRARHQIIPEGTYIKTIIRNNDNIPINYYGNPKTNQYDLNQGFMQIIFCEKLNEEELTCVDVFFELLAEDIIPNSLKYYLQERYEECQPVAPNCN